MSEIVKHESKAPKWLEPSSMDKAIELAEMLSKSELVPKDYIGKPANVMIAMIAGAEVGISPFKSMQNLHIVRGKPAWDSNLLIEEINKSSAIKGRLKFKVEKPNDTIKVGPETWPVTAYTAWAEDAADGSILEGQTITTKTMVHARWHLNKSGNVDQFGPWIRDHEHMLMLRAAKRWSKRYGIGVSGDTVEDVMDMQHDDETASTKDDINTRLGAVTVEPTPIQSTPKSVAELADEEVTFEDVKPDPEPPKTKAKLEPKSTPKSEAKTKGKPDPNNPIDMVPKPTPDPAETAPAETSEGDLFG